MSPIVRVVSGGEPAEIFVPIEDMPVVLSDLRRHLPELRKELRKQWPVEGVYIRQRTPRRRNPPPLTLLHTNYLTDAVIGLAIILGGGVVNGLVGKLGKSIGEGIGDRIKRTVMKWLKARSGKRKPARRKPNKHKNPRSTRRRSYHK